MGGKTMTVMTKTGKQAMIEQFLADGIQYMFGNPGTVEQGFLDVLEEYKEFKYILTLQETIAVAAADGYARATKKPTVVQLHSGVGLGNGIGMLYQAKRGHAPLVVIAGEAGTQYDAMDAQMAADLVEMAKPVTKWATRVIHPSSLLRVLRRAIKIAATPPMGPVFVSLPLDILDAPVEEKVVPTSLINTTVLPEKSIVEEAASYLLQSKNPMMIIGDGIAFSGAQQELEKVAELVGAEVWGADSSEVNMNALHPQFKGLLGHMFGSHSRDITSKSDVVLIIGTYVFPEVFPALQDVFAPEAKVIHIDLDAYEIGKNFPVDLGVMSDPKVTLQLLATILEESITPEFLRNAQQRIVTMKQMKEQQLQEQLVVDEQLKNLVPLVPAAFMKELSEQIPENSIIFDEALTSSPDLVRYIPPVKEGSYFQTRGGSLGVGIPGALGIKLAKPEQTVIAFTGDGGSMYTIQALWTAAHHDINAKFIICNNRSYKLLKLNIIEYWNERNVDVHEFPQSFELNKPNIDFCKLAESMGVKAAKVENPEDIKPVIEEALRYEGPYLIDLVISNEVEGQIHWKCGQ